jgi:membrane-associated protease RseP (regulator of RpoE activity)
MINLDMVGRLREGKLYVFGAGTAKEWGSIYKLTDVKGIDPIISPFVRMDSDQASFYRRNLPVAFFYTGLHPEYHSEKDTIATLNIPGIALVANYVAQVIHLADAVPHKMAFTSENTAAVGPQGSGQGRKVRIGFIPDMADNGPGVLLSGVSASTPAEKAGLKAGDRIVEFNGVKMTDLQSLQDQMMKLVAGAMVKVAFERNGERKEVELTVEARE